MGVTKDVTKDFNPGLSHPYYFIRRGLYNAMNKFAPSLNGKLLDFGCGSKPYQALIKVDEYTGLDFQNPGHDHSKEQIDVYYDGNKIPFPDEHFDSVLSSEVFEHLFNLPHTLEELHRVMKKGGKILLTCPFIWNEHELPYDYARYTQFALKDLLEKKGFRVLEFEKRGNFVEAIAQVRALYYVQVAGPFFSRLSFVGKFLLRSSLFLVNGWGRIKSAVFPKRFDLYLSNIFLAEKI